MDHRHAGRPPRLWGAQALLQSHEHDPRGEHLAPVGRYRGVQARAGIIACAQYPRQSGGEPPAAARPGDPDGSLLDERVAMRFRAAGQLPIELRSPVARLAGQSCSSPPFRSEADRQGGGVNARQTGNGHVIALRAGAWKRRCTSG